MALTAVKALFKFKEDIASFSEYHLYNASNPVTVVPAAIQYIGLRMRISGFQVTPIGITLSQLGQFRNAIEVDPSQFAGLAPAFAIYATPPNPVTGQGASTAGNEPDQPRSCVLATLYGAQNQTRKFFMAGVPDFVIRENPTGPATAVPAQWLSDFNIFKATLLNQWGFASSTQVAGGAPRYKVTGPLATNGLGEIGVPVNTAAITFNVNDTIQLRNFKMANRAYRPINGKWIVSSVALATPAAGLNTYYLQNSQTVNVANVALLGTVNATDKFFVPYTSLQLTGETTRKRGKSFLEPPGRRKIPKYV